MDGKKFKVLFFQVNTLQNPRNFEDFLKNLQRLPDDERTSKRGIRLDNVMFDSQINVWYGALTKVRMDNLPEKINQKNGKLAPLPITAEEGIAEMTAFLYVPDIKILLIQKSQYGPLVTALAEYFQEKFAALPIDFRIVLRNDALQKLKSMCTVHLFELKTARIEPDAFSSDESAINFLQSLYTSDCLKIDLCLRTDKKSSLAGWIITFAQQLCGLSDRVKRIKIGGMYEDGRSDLLDLLQYKREEVVNLTLPSIRTISFENRKSALAQAYIRNNEDLHKLYGVC